MVTEEPELNVGVLQHGVCGSVKVLGIWDLNAYI